MRGIEAQSAAERAADAGSRLEEARSSMALESNEVAEARSAAAGAVSASEAASAAVKQAQQAARRAASQVAALRMQVVGCDGSRRASKEAERLQELHESLEARRPAAQAALDAATKDAEAAAKNLKAAQEAEARAAADAATATAQLEDKQARFNQASARVHSAKSKLAVAHQAHKELLQRRSQRQGEPGAVQQPRGGGDGARPPRGTYISTYTPAPPTYAETTSRPDGDQGGERGSNAGGHTTSCSEHETAPEGQAPPAGAKRLRVVGKGAGMKKSGQRPTHATTRVTRRRAQQVIASDSSDSRDNDVESDPTDGESDQEARGGRITSRGMAPPTEPHGKKAIRSRDAARHWIGNGRPVEDGRTTTIAGQSGNEKGSKRAQERLARKSGTRRRQHEQRAGATCSSQEQLHPSADSDEGGCEDHLELDLETSWQQDEAAEEQLCQQSSSLDAEERALAKELSRVDSAVLESDLRALRRIEDLRGQGAEVEGRRAALAGERDELVNERHGRMVQALQAVNVSLPRVYRALTGCTASAAAAAADAHCSFSEAQLFAEGVSLVLRPPGQRWRPFAALSGGQQALAALALSFALQELFPSPFYWFDEIDASLDTRAAARVAGYVLRLARDTTTEGAAPAQGGGLPPQQAHSSNAIAPSAQYVIVSHKPQVFERAQCLLGVYGAANGGSEAVVAHGFS